MFQYQFLIFVQNFNTSLYIHLTCIKLANAKFIYYRWKVIYKCFLFNSMDENASNLHFIDSIHLK